MQTIVHMIEVFSMVFTYERLVTMLALKLFRLHLSMNFVVVRNS